MKRKRAHKKPSALFVALFALVSLMGFVGSAQAATGPKWYVGSSSTPISAQESVTIRPHGGTSLLYKIGSNEVPVRFESTRGFECVGVCSISNSYQRGEYLPVNEAAGKVTLKLTGVKVVEPSNCTLQSAKGENEVLETNLLDWQVGSEGKGNLKAHVGETLWSFNLTGSKCGLAGTGYRSAGIVGFNMVNPPGVSAVEQTVMFNPGTSYIRSPFGGLNSRLEGSVGVELASHTNFQYR